MPDNGRGTVYLIHFDRPFGHAQHYLGWALDLPTRIKHHRRSTGSRLLAVVNEAGIGWRVVRTWQGGRDVEARKKKQGGRARHCPVCNPSLKAPVEEHDL
jgi:predicted GIY-YIG superfamily endonuclease